ncbi:hypothetical protein REJC140_01732 [Pseudorhizobium endolithicum]|uniref:Uncharacterized protein n=1 Tax=Pseudorhizobium endolithicum TaxID=1191678 RepID=A0ABN7JZP5_9HYPH|nr:hypothetical protein [Pseudorhizobium endolithicum]CAD7051474.1 hypothetical protein REJC140_01732 [Pseudorhizobium endolithicum]
MTDAIGAVHRESGNVAPTHSARPVLVTALYALVTIAMLLAMSIPSATDYVGDDNDDIMRLVQVRDLLVGQGWFDLMQYRLGLEGGTPMHWSRLVDLPIAALIRAGSLFLTQSGAEAVALTVWPLLLIPFLLYPLGLAAHRLAGPVAMHVALGLGCLFAFTCIRFHPGAIDHHNLQLVLAAWVAAMLADPDRRPSSYAAAGSACAFSIAIGAEMVPFVAAACLCVALQWIWNGDAAGRAARSFGIALAVAISIAFFLTVPPNAYGAVTCDSLSLGFYALSAMGGALLACVTGLWGGGNMRGRLGLAALIAATLAATVLVIAPQCLGSPLSGLDPMLVTLWLDAVTEAQSFRAILSNAPYSLGGYYAVGFLAMAVCLFRALRGEAREVHLVLLLLIGATWAVALVQVRGFFFANMLAILPLSLLIVDLRLGSQADPENPNAAFAYVMVVLLSVPAVWALAGALLDEGAETPIGMETVAQDSGSRPQSGECSAEGGLPLLAELDPGVVAAPSNSGAEILRFTGHRVLAAPYHRNQAGMLTELHIGLAPPEEARAFLDGAGVTLLAFCGSDPQTRSLIQMKPDGLYAVLSRGKVPSYLHPVGTSEGGFSIFRVEASR